VAALTAKLTVLCAGVDAIPAAASIAATMSAMTFMARTLLLAGYSKWNTLSYPSAPSDEHQAPETA
jgi:hypothetical protein